MGWNIYTPYQVYIFHLIYCLRPSTLSLLVVTQIRGHIAGSSSPLPTTVRALHFYRENISALPSSTCVELCLPTLGALSSWPFFFFFFLQIYFKISPRRDSNSRTNTSSICGLPLVSPPGRPPYTYTRYLVILHNCTAVEYL